MNLTQQLNMRGNSRYVITMVKMFLYLNKTYFERVLRSKYIITYLLFRKGHTSENIIAMAKTLFLKQCLIYNPESFDKPKTNLHIT